MKREEYCKLIERIYYSDQNICLARQFYDCVRGYLSGPVKLAYEVGCGYGLAASFFRKEAEHLLLMDTDQDALGFVKGKYGASCTTSCEEVISGCPDLIYFFLSLHHIGDFRARVADAIAHVLDHEAVVAICEFEPHLSVVFHQHEPAAHDGISRSEFLWILNEFPSVRLEYKDMPSIESHGTLFHCYCLVISKKDT